MEATQTETRSNAAQEKFAYEPPRGMYIPLKLAEGIQLTGRGGSPDSYCAEGCPFHQGSCK
jgi:hypothetical protein